MVREILQIAIINHILKNRQLRQIHLKLCENNNRGLENISSNDNDERRFWEAATQHFPQKSKNLTILQIIKMCIRTESHNYFH